MQTGRSEDVVIGEVMGELERLGLTLEEEDFVYGPHLHRWGAAFVDPDTVVQDTGVVESLNLGFIGDYIEEPGAARGRGGVERAVEGGVRMAERVAVVIGERVGKGEGEL